MSEPAPGRPRLARGDALAVVCGGGAFPGAVIEAVTAAGLRAVPIALRGIADASLARFSPVSLSIGEVGGLFRTLQGEKARGVVLVGSLSRPDLSSLKVDWGAMKRLPDIARLARGGDDGLLRGVVAIIEGEGYPVYGVAEVAPSLVAPVGDWAGPPLSAEARADIATGLACLDALSPFDVGQALVVADGRIIAVEAAEGTDAMLARVAALRENGRFRAPRGRGILVKAAKTGQDLRIDMPAVGPATVDAIAAAGLAGLAVEAGRVLALDRAEMAARARAAGVVLHGFTRGTSA